MSHGVKGVGGGKLSLSPSTIAQRSPVCVKCHKLFLTASALVLHGQNCSTSRRYKVINLPNRGSEEGIAQPSLLQNSDSLNREIVQEPLEEESGSHASSEESDSSSLHHEGVEDEGRESSDADEGSESSTDSVPTVPQLPRAQLESVSGSSISGISAVEEQPVARRVLAVLQQQAAFWQLAILQQQAALHQLAVLQWQIALRQHSLRQNVMRLFGVSPYNLSLSASGSAFVCGHCTAFSTQTERELVVHLKDTHFEGRDPSARVVIEKIGGVTRMHFSEGV